MDKQRKLYLLVHTVRCLLALAFFAAITRAAAETSMFVSVQMRADVSRSVLYALHILLSMLAYHSFFRAFLLTDARARTAYVLSEKEKLEYLCTATEVRISGISTAVFYVLFSDAFAVGSLAAWLEIPYMAAFFILLIPAFCVLLWTWLEVLSEWKKTEEALQKTGKSRKENRLLIKYCISACLAYPILGYLIPIFCPTFRTLGDILWMLLVLVLPIALVCIAVLFSFLFVRAFWIRFRFFGKLQKAARRHSYKLSEIKHPYSSVFFDHDASNFTVKAHGKTYTCKLLCGLCYGDPMYFEDEGKGKIIRYISLRFRTAAGAPFAPGRYIWQKLPADLMQYRIDFKYTFDGEGTKILIVCPTPHSIYATANGQNRLLDVNDKIYGYTLMTGTAFLNALERDAIC